jgi:hypothetical protein
MYHIRYVVEWKYTTWVKENLTIKAVCPIFKKTHTLDHCTVIDWGTCTIFDASTMKLIDAQMLERYPILKK